MNTTKTQSDTLIRKPNQKPGANSQAKSFCVCLVPPVARSPVLKVGGRVVRLSGVGKARTLKIY